MPPRSWRRFPPGCRNQSHSFDILPRTNTREVAMRKIVAGLFVSLDVVADAPDGWHFPFLTDEWHEVIDAEIAQTDSVLLGRRTYADFAQLWPNQGSDVPMADFMNNTRKYVVSSTLETLEWANSTLLTGPLVEELTRLKHEPGRNILILGFVLEPGQLLDERTGEQGGVGPFQSLQRARHHVLASVVHEVGHRYVAALVGP